MVYTSSSAAALSPHPDEELTVTEDTWNQEAVDQVNTNPDPWSVYAASKTEAERAIWKLVNETEPPFQVVRIFVDRRMSGSHGYEAVSHT